MHVNCIFHHLHREEPNLIIEKCQILKLVRQSFNFSFLMIFLKYYHPVIVPRCTQTEVTLHKDRGDEDSDNKASLKVGDIYVTCTNI